MGQATSGWGCIWKGRTRVVTLRDVLDPLVVVFVGHGTKRLPDWDELLGLGQVGTLLGRIE